MVSPTKKFQVEAGGGNLQIKKDLRDKATNCNVLTFLDPDSNKYCIKQTLWDNERFDTEYLMILISSVFRCDNSFAIMFLVHIFY